MVTNAEYNKAKDAVNNQYTEESIQNYSNAYNNYLKQGLSSADALAKAKGLLVNKNTTPTNIPTQNTTQTTGSSVSKTNNSNATKVSGNTVLPEYQGSGNQNKVQTSYANQGNGNYTYNPTSGYYEKNQNYSTIRDAWDSKTYEQQQELLKNNPNLKEGIAKVGGTIKQSPYQNQGEGQYQYNPKTGYYEKQGSQGGNETPTNKGGWDYQDNSPERTAEIIRNLDDLSKSNPGLFSDYDTFYNAFIAGKGRSPEQIKVLNDYFNQMKQYNKYDNLSSDAVGQGIAQGLIPDEYLSYLKYNDPQRYAEIQEARKGAETQIMNEGNLITIAESAGYDMGTGSNFWKWNTTEMGFRDVNNDGLDDRLYHEPSEEEKKLWEEDANYEAERLKIQNAYKDLQSDLTDQYPDADLSTIMVLTSDRGNKMLKAMDTLNVSQTKVQGMIKYMQNERATQDKAGQATINELQKNLGMYYDYTPEGISELAQAQYAATNVTLDQADNGTDTQKQMALDRVLSDYYDKYGSIIQRSKSQVINDVMAYAKNNGVSLSQALKDNFLKYLREKPWYSALSNGGTSPKVSFEKVGDTGYIFTVNPDGTYSIDTIGGNGTYGSNGVYQFSDGEVREIGADGKYKDTIGNDINSIGHILDSEDGLRIGTYTSSKGYTYNVYATREDGIKATENLLKRGYYGMTLGDAAQKWIGQGKDISDAKSVIKSKGLSLNDKLSDDNVRKFIEAMGTWEGTLKGKSLDDWANEGKTINGPTNSNNSGYDPLLVDFFQKDPTKLTKDQWAKLKNMGYDERTYLSMRNNYLQGLAKEPDDTTVKILDTLGELMTKYPGEWYLKSTMIGTDYLDNDLGDYIANYDFIKNNLTMDNLVRLKSNGATFGSLTEGERPKIETSASKLNKDKMSEAAFKAELLDIYNAYAKKAGMGELTLNDIYNMYGGDNNTTSSPTINPMPSLKNSSTQTNDGEVDWDVAFAQIQ